MECKFRNTVTAYDNNLNTKVGRGPRLNIGEVKAEVQVRQDLASAYKLHPPIHAVLRFIAEIKR
jgi:hypothetical protein